MPSRCLERAEGAATTLINFFITHPVGINMLALGWILDIVAVVLVMAGVSASVSRGGSGSGIASGAGNSIGS